MLQFGNGPFFRICDLTQRWQQSRKNHLQLDDKSTYRLVDQIGSDRYFFFFPTEEQKVLRCCCV